MHMILMKKGIFALLLTIFATGYAEANNHYHSGSMLVFSAQDSWWVMLRQTAFKVGVDSFIGWVLEDKERRTIFVGLVACGAFVSASYALHNYLKRNGYFKQPKKAEQYLVKLPSSAADIQ